MSRKKRKVGSTQEPLELQEQLEAADTPDFEQLLQASSEGLLVLSSPARRVLWLNASCCRLLELSQEQVLGQDFSEEQEAELTRTSELDREVLSWAWAGQPAFLHKYSVRPTAPAASFSTEWRLEAAEERAREAEALVEQLQAQLLQQKSSEEAEVSLELWKEREADLKAESEQRQLRLQEMEHELQQAELRAELAQERAVQSERLLSQSEQQYREREKQEEDQRETLAQARQQEWQEQQAEFRELELLYLNVTTELEQLKVDRQARAHLPQPEELEDQLRQLRESLADRLLQSEMQDGRIHELESLLEQARQASPLLEQLRLDFEDLQQHIHIIESERDSLGRKLDRREEQLQALRAEMEQKVTQIDQANQRCGDLELQFNDLRGQLQQGQLDLTQLQQLRQELQDQLLEREAQLEDFQSQFTRFQHEQSQQAEALHDELGRREGEMAELLAQLEDQSRLKAPEPDPTLQLELEQLRELLAQKEGELALLPTLAAQAQRVSALESQLENSLHHEVEVAELRLKVSQLESQLEHSRQNEVEVAELRHKISQAESDRAEGDPRVAELEEQLLTLQQKLRSQPAESLPLAHSQEVEQLAYEDSLTKLANFNLLQRYLDFSLKQVDRYQRKCALIRLDIDRLQAINEALGHQAGDQVLQQVAERLQAAVRTSDVICRRSEDDFLILLSEVAGEANAPESISVVVKRIQDAMEPPISAGGQPIQVTLSLGISQFPHDADSGQAMLRQVESALQRAKEIGRGQVQFFTEELQKRHDARTTLEIELRKGLDGRQFSLLYQPIVHLPTGLIKGVETLLRWNHPSYGVLTPDYFIEVADETGIMLPLGRWIMTLAAQQLYEWSRQGLDLFVTVNLTTRQFLQADLVENLRRTLESTGAPAHNFVLEVPESVQMLDIQRVHAILLSLRQLGVRVALDRFGSGFSSLERLHSELVALLKVDRKFLFHAASNAAALNVTVAALGLARGLRVRPVAVGIENATQLSLCRQLECEYVQGNLIYVPTDATQVAELAKAGKLLR